MQVVCFEKDVRSVKSFLWGNFVILVCRHYGFMIIRRTTLTIRITCNSIGNGNSQVFARRERPGWYNSSAQLNWEKLLFEEKIVEILTSASTEVYLWSRFSRPSQPNGRHDFQDTPNHPRPNCGSLNRLPCYVQLMFNVSGFDLLSSNDLRSQFRGALHLLPFQKGGSGGGDASS